VGFREVCSCATSLPEIGIDGIPANYGLGCAAHDETGAVFSACQPGSDIRPAYCYRFWCYVLSTCSLTQSFGIPFDVSPLNYSRSYATCGQLAPDQSEAIINHTFFQRPLRMLLLNNTNGWTGSYLDPNGVSVINRESEVPGYGPVVSFFLDIAAVEQIQIELIDPSLPFPAPVLALASQTNSYFSKEEQCAIAASLCYVDLCVGDIPVTGDTTWIARYLPPHNFDSVDMIVKVTWQQAGFGFFRIFEPFTDMFWLILFLFVCVFSMAFAWVEQKSLDFHGLDRATSLAKSFYLSAMGWVSASPAYSPGSLGGHLMAVGFGWLIALVFAAYTANLAQLLVVSVSAQGKIDSVAAFFASPTTVLCISTSPEPWLEVYPSLRGRLRASVDVLADVDAELCDAGALPNQELLLENSLGNFCLLTSVGQISTVAVAMASCPNIHYPLSVLVQSRLGSFRSKLVSLAPVSTCPALVQAPSSQLDENEMSGALVISAFFLVAGLCVHAYQLATHTDNADVFGSTRNIVPPDPTGALREIIRSELQAQLTGFQVAQSFDEQASRNGQQSSTQAVVGSMTTC